ncbi:MAG: hypothetical protein ACREOG_05220 [Gemmatimonadaceae bacterium]
MSCGAPTRFYARPRRGFVYVEFVIDACSRRIVGGRARSISRFLTERLAEVGSESSFGSHGDSYDNARLLEPLGYLPPAEYEDQCHRTETSPVEVWALT